LQVDKHLLLQAAPVPNPRKKKKKKTKSKKCESADNLTELTSAESTMYPRHHSLSQQQLGIPLLPDVTFRESPSLVFPGYRPPAIQGSIL
jgi:hypothetical protein